MSSKKEIEQEILSLCESEENFEAFYPSIEDQILAKDKPLIQVIVNVAANALDTNSKPPTTNFLLLLLIQKAIVKRSSEMINEVHSSDAFLKAIEKIARHDKNNKDPNRGKTLYPRESQVGQQMLILVLEFIAKMASSFKEDSSKKPTKFKLLHTKLETDGVTFPKEPYLFFEKKKKKQQPTTADDQGTQQSQSSKTPGSTTTAGQPKSGKNNQTAALKIMEEIKQYISFLIDSLNISDDFDEDSKKEFATQTQRFTKNSQTLTEIIQQEADLSEELIDKIFKHIEFITNFCDHSQEVIRKGYNKESTLKFKDWLFSQEYPFSLDDEESQSIKKHKAENEKMSSKNEKIPSDNFDFNSFPNEQQQQSQVNKFQSQQISKQLQDEQEDAFGAFGKSAVNNRQQQQSNIPIQQQFKSEINNSNNNLTGSKTNNMINQKNPKKVTNILEDDDDEEEEEQQRLKQAELDRQMRKQREDEEKLKKQQEDERLRRQKEAEDKLKKQQQQEEEERIRRQKEIEDRQRRQKEEEDKLRKQQQEEEQQNALRKQKEEEQNALRRQKEEDERKRARIQQDEEEAEKMRQLLKEQQEQSRILEENERSKVQQLINSKPQSNQNSKFSTDYQRNRFSFNGDEEQKPSGYFFTPQQSKIQEQGGYVGAAEEQNRLPANPNSKIVNTKQSKIEQAFGEAPQEKFSFGDPIRNQNVNPSQIHNNPYNQNDISQIGGRNNPSQIGQNFPKLIKLIDNKVYKGVQVNGSQVIDRILTNNQYDAINKRYFKKANLKQKNTIYEDSRFQIGCVSKLKFDPTNQQNYLNIQIYVGNKTRLGFREVKIEFDGDDKTCYVHSRIEKTIEEYITAKTQQNMEIYIGHYDVPYGLVNIILTGQLGPIESSEEVNIVAFLPNLLTKYFTFMDIDAFEFKQKWKQMRMQIQKTDIFTISKTIIKTPVYFKKFFTKTLELTPLDIFLSQQNEDTKYYKLGALIELYNAESKFLLKFNIRPDNTLCIQIIALNQVYRSTAEVILQHLRFLFQG